MALKHPNGLSRGSEQQGLWVRPCHGLVRHPQLLPQALACSSWSKHFLENSCVSLHGKESAGRHF